MNSNGVPTIGPEQKLLRALRNLPLEEQLDEIRLQLKEGRELEDLLQIFPECIGKVEEELNNR